MERIIFYSKENIASFLQNEKIDDYFSNIYPNKSDFEVNDILELYHICQYIDNGFLSEIWNSKKQIEVLKELKKKINIYINSLKSNDISSVFSYVDFDYQKAFFQILNQSNNYTKISETDLDEIFQNRRFQIRSFLSCKNLVANFEGKIKDFILSKTTHAELLLSYYEERRDYEESELFFPKSLTFDDKEELINRYLDDENANINYVRLIEKNKDSEFLYFHDKTRLKAKRVSTKLNNEIFEHGYVTTVKQGVILADDQEEIRKIIQEDGRRITSYNRHKLMERTDSKSLLRLFKNPFGIIDFQGGINLVSRNTEADGWESSFIQSKNEFFISSEFQYKSFDASIHFETYLYLLNENNIRIEDVIHSFVNEYLNSTFPIDNLKIHLPNQSLNYLEKNRLLVPEFEFLLKQYKLFVEDDFVDDELLQINTKPLKFNKIPSILEKKYVYANGTALNKIFYTFFRYMSPLFNYNKYAKEYSNLYQILVSKGLNKNELKSNYEISYLKDLISDNLLTISENGDICIVDQDLILLSSLLYKFDVISYWHSPENLRLKMDEMEANGLVVFGDTLLTKSEQDYFDYHLNNRFSNGFWLRNKYAHATNTLKEDEQERDYKILLKLICLLILKIEDDLKAGVKCLRSQV
jgi:hypothetical protein